MPARIHPLAQVATSEIGDGTVIWQFAVVLKGARIGCNCNINCHTFIESDVVIGDNVTVKSGVYLWNGLRIESNVFLGPNATFVNDLRPRSKRYPEKFNGVTVQQGASIGAHATVLGGVTVGRYALVGAGSVVTRDVEPHALVVGNPARVSGHVDEQARKLKALGGTLYQDKDGAHWQLIEGRMISADRR